MRVSVTESESEGRSLEMLRRWKTADLVVLPMWDRNERVESRVTPRFHTSGDGEVEQPSMTWARSQTFLSSGAGAGNCWAHLGPGFLSVEVDHLKLEGTTPELSEVLMMVTTAGQRVGRQAFTRVVGRGSRLLDVLYCVWMVTGPYGIMSLLCLDGDWAVWYHVSTVVVFVV